MGVMNNVSEQRYQHAVDGMEDEMENLVIQIRIVISTIGRQPAAKTAGPPPI